VPKPRQASANRFTRQILSRRRKGLRFEPLEIRRLLTLDTVFEIEGNAIASAADPGLHDWDEVYSDAVTQALPIGRHAIARVRHRPGG